MTPDQYSIMPAQSGDRENVESPAWPDWPPGRLDRPHPDQEYRDKIKGDDEVAERCHRERLEREAEERGGDDEDYPRERFRPSTGDLSGNGLTDWERNQ